MNSLKELPQYQFLEDVLSPYGISAAELHGIMSAFICSGESISLLILYDYIFVSEEKCELEVDINAAIQELIDYSEAKISNLEFDYQLFLPSDDVPLAYRSEALSTWCQGFSIALKDAGLDLKALSEDSQKAIEHINKIAQLDYATIQAGEEDEKAFMEITEYLRMVVLMIYSECTQTQMSKSPDSYLH